MQNATTLPINDSVAFLAIMKLLTASNQVAGLWALPFRDKLRVLRTLTLAELQARQKIRPYQQLRYWSTVPFRHGATDIVKFSAKPSADNPAAPLRRNSPSGLQDELDRHLREDARMSANVMGKMLFITFSSPMGQQGLSLSRALRECHACRGRGTDGPMRREGDMCNVPGQRGYLEGP